MIESVVGIDASLSHTVVCAAVFKDPEPGGYEWCESGNKIPADEIRERLVRYGTIVEPIIAFLTPLNPKLILIEGYSFASKGRATHSLAEFGGVFRMNLALALPEAILLDVAPTRLKKFITGKGNASKAEMVSTLAKKRRITFESDDHADAYALCILAECVKGNLPPLCRAGHDVLTYERERFEKIMT